MKKKPPKTCQCGLLALTRARSKYGVQRWRRVVSWHRPGCAIEHGADICWAIKRKDFKGYGPRDGASTWEAWVTQTPFVLTMPLQRVADLTKNVA